MSDRICKTLGKHANALREIQLLLDRKPWMLSEVRRIAHILEKAGYAVHTAEGERAYTPENYVER